MKLFSQITSKGRQFGERVGRRNWRLMGMCAIILAIVLLATSIGDAVQVFGNTNDLPIYSVGREHNFVALTFDTAWGDDKTNEILAILDQHDVPATFFAVGFWVDKYPEKAKMIVEQGHEIANHSTNHPHMPQLSPQEIKIEVDATNRKIEEKTGRKPTLFRAPYGEYDSIMLQTIRAMGMEVVQWDVDAMDWKDLTASQIQKRVRDQARPGSILLFQNNYQATVDALPEIIEYLKSQRYEFLLTSDLIFPAPYTIDSNGRQYMSS